mmetsp:Transcript_104246/g.331459  ORF Transcript_104246/g.331459 Transcript_104246/m.331459 type:complete len:234 (-) Transcript_104246:30-731(-)
MAARWALRVPTSAAHLLPRTPTISCAVNTLCLTASISFSAATMSRWASVASAVSMAMSRRMSSKIRCCLSLNSVHCLHSRSFCCSASASRRFNVPSADSSCAAPPKTSCPRDAAALRLEREAPLPAAARSDRARVNARSDGVAPLCPWRMPMASSRGMRRRASSPDVALPRRAPPERARAPRRRASTSARRPRRRSGTARTGDRRCAAPAGHGFIMRAGGHRPQADGRCGGHL